MMDNIDDKSIYAREMVKAQKEAYSFPGTRPPNGAWYIGSITKNNDTYNYYKDEDGNYYYDTDKERKFEVEMQQAQRKRRQARYAIQ